MPRNSETEKFVNVSYFTNFGMHMQFRKKSNQKFKITKGEKYAVLMIFSMKRKKENELTSDS